MLRFLSPLAGRNHRIDRIAERKTYKDVYDDILTDNNLTRGMMNNDPRALVEWNKRMSQGEPVAPEYEEMVERMNMGEMPAPDTVGNEYTGDEL